MAREDLTLRELNSLVPEAKPRRSNSLRASKSCCLNHLRCTLAFPKAEGGDVTYKHYTMLYTGDIYTGVTRGYIEESCLLCLLLYRDNVIL
jgi:hypothetical protein